MYRFYENLDIFKEMFSSLFFIHLSLHHSIKRKCLMSLLKTACNMEVLDRIVYKVKKGINIFSKRGVSGEGGELCAPP